MKTNSCGCGPGGCGGDRPTRRDVLRAAALIPGLRFMAGPFRQADFEKLVPADKKLDPDWVKSLTARGERAVWRGAEIEKIGMPVGGICSGQLYLGGDGKLWHWDLFNKQIGTGDGHYRSPMKPSSPLDQGFALRVRSGDKAVVKSLDRRGFADVRFCGEYPIGFVEYRDEAVPVTVSLEAFSPFIPLDTAESSLPATVFRFTLKNAGAAKAEVELSGWLENAVGLHTKADCIRRNRILETAQSMVLECSAGDAPRKEESSDRPDILFEDFEKETYEGWTATGTAFGTGPAEKAKMPGYQGDVGSRGKRLVNTHNTRGGEDVAGGDAHTGTLTSRAFTIERNYVTFLVGGGGHKGKTGVNLLLDGKVVESVTGKNDNKMSAHSFDVRAHAGKKAQIQIVDQETGGWGNIGVDHIVFSDRPGKAPTALQDQPDFGTMTLAMLGPREGGQAAASLPDGALPEALFAEAGLASGQEPARPMGQKLAGALSRTVKLDPGAEARVTFAITWHFPNLRLKDGGRHYANRFPSAAAVTEHLVKNIDTLIAQTRLWHDTWYDSTLPYWFLDRTFIPICTLATSTCYQFDPGRFYAFEGVLCCQGSCQHVWNYAQSVARIFPELERDLRQRTDFGTAWHDNGATDYRGECARHVAHDGQCGVILRAYREHQMAPDDAYLRQCWPRIRKSVEYLIGCDGDENGIIEGEQYNTLDASWWGAMAWISSFYIAALRAGEAMAGDVGDPEFGARCRRIAERGSEQLVKLLFNGEYFIHKPDPKHPEGTNTNDGCHIDQLMGQAWALQVGLPRIVPLKESGSALEAIWRYNFTPDAGAYRNAMQGVIKGGRWYAMPGEGGVVMTTFPRGGADRSSGRGGFAFYFNEVWTGQEHQLAAHMLWEGLVEKALVITRMVHDRHHAARRNPFNEVECSDHYARAMSSYGTFLAACGFEHHGPKAHLGFAPRLTPENFRCPFTTAEGWGTFSQQSEISNLKSQIQVRWGRLRLRTLSLGLRPGFRPTKVAVTLAGKQLPAALAVNAGKAGIKLGEALVLNEGERLEVELS
jgi:non-lysosomal glucosylceramidase